MIKGSEDTGACHLLAAEQVQLRRWRTVADDYRAFIIDAVAFGLIRHVTSWDCAMASTETRFVRSPLTAAMVAALEPECRWVDILGGEPLSDQEAAQLAEVMRSRPDAGLSILPRHLGSTPDLDILQWFPWLHKLIVDSHSLRDLSGLTHLTGLRTLYLSQSRHRLSLKPVASLAGSLRHLQVEGLVSHVEALSELTGLLTLTLRSVTLPAMSVLAPMTNLRGLDLKLGGTSDLSLLPCFTRLQYFEAWMIRGLTDLSALAAVTSLEELHLEALKHVTRLPPLHNLTRLRRITLHTMKGLEDLTVLLTAPALEELRLTGMDHLTPEKVIHLAAHPALKKANIGLGADWKNAAARAGLPLPPIDSPGLYPALRLGQQIADPQ
jgi:hypothetical protein